MTICISNCYRRILQCNRRCANIFYRCNVIIVRRFVVTVEFFIIAYIIYILIFRMCILCCSFNKFYIFDAIILTRILCVFFPTYFCERVEQTTMIAFLTQSRANLNLAMCWSPKLTTSSTLTHCCSIDCYSAWLISACICAAKSVERLYSIYCAAGCAVIVVWWFPLLILMAYLHIYC